VALTSDPGSAAQAGISLAQAMLARGAGELIGDGTR
jgi:hypothetical protein